MRNIDVSVKALVIDDNEVSNLILTNMLELHGIHSDQAKDGREGLHLCQKNQYDIIFVDHYMPKMDGIQTTRALRNTIQKDGKPFIIALSSDVTDLMKELYYTAGANDIYIKPLGLSDLSLLLKRVDFRVEFNNDLLKNENITYSDMEMECNGDILRQLENMIDSVSLKSLSTDLNQIVKILEVSLNDLQSSISIITNGYRKNSLEQLHMGTHKLKNIYENLGAIKLSKTNDDFWEFINKRDIKRIDEQYDSFVEKLENYKIALLNAIDVCNSHIKPENVSRDEMLMSSEEHEQCLLNTIYYIRRFEFDLIIREIQRLVLYGQKEWKQEYEAALLEVNGFCYEQALSRILKIKKEVGKLPIPDENKYMKLKNFWDQV